MKTAVIKIETEKSYEVNDEITKEQIEEAIESGDIAEAKGTLFIKGKKAGQVIDIYEWDGKLTDWEETEEAV